LIVVDTPTGLPGPRNPEATHNPPTKIECVSRR